MTTMERRDAGPAGVERRVIVPEDLEVRSEGGGPKRIVGHASVFNRWTTLYESDSYVWREIIRPDAFSSAIAERQDVRSLFNHDANFILGRTAAGTLLLNEDDVGVLSDTEPSDSQSVRDFVLIPMSRREITQMSFSFIPRRGAQTVTTSPDGLQVMSNGGERVTIRRDGNRIVEEREILSVNLFDTSPVTYPAYEQTDVALRSCGAAKEAELRQRVLAEQKSRKKAQLGRMRMRFRLAEARMGR